MKIEIDLEEYIRLLDFWIHNERVALFGNPNRNSYDEGKVREYFDSVIKLNELNSVRTEKKD